MRQKSKRKRDAVDLAAIQDELIGIISRIADVDVVAPSIGNLDSAVKAVHGIRRNASKLAKHAEKLIRAIEQRRDPPPKPSRGGGSGARVSDFQQDSASECCYSGPVKFGSAQMWECIVPTIHEAMKDWDAHEELGFLKVTIEEDVMHGVDPEKIGNSTVNTSDECQSKTLRFSGMSKSQVFHGLVCDVTIEEDPSSEFRIPQLDTDGELDGRRLFCSTVRDASRSHRKPYLVNPVESSSRWRESVGLPQEPYLDCGERLKMTRSKIPGIHTAYEYCSIGRGSGSAMHVEDAYLGSMNFVLAGAPKVWLLVQPKFRWKLEAKFRDNLIQDAESCSCSQFVRHSNKLLSPELLDSWEIPYHIVSCKAGEMIVTLSETYHQVVNAGTNYAVAVNFAVGSDWTGTPAGYKFCGTTCNPDTMPITAVQLTVQGPLTPSPGITPDGCDFGEDSERLEPEQDPASRSVIKDTKDLDDDLKNFIEATIRSATPDSPRSGSEGPRYPPTPGNPAADTPEELLDTPIEGNPDHEGPEARRDEAIRSNGEGRHEGGDSGSGRAPPGGNNPGLASGGEASEAHGGGSPLHKDVERSIDAVEARQAAAEPPRNGDGEARDVRGSEKGPIEIIEDSEDDYSNLVVELPLKRTVTTPRTAESVGTKIDRLINEALPFIQALEISKRALECFRLRQRLNDEAILKTLETILPDQAMPLIASFAIANSPPSGLSADFVDFGTPPKDQPRLVHEIGSTHLFIACNVQAHTLQAVNGSGNHWILIVVDFPSRKMHLFGAEKGLEIPAKTILRNTAAFINSFRITKGYPGIDWEEPDTQPLYSTGWFPDDYNCGVAVISRAEAFMYPEKALETPAGTTPAELSERLDELRATYLDSIVRRCNRVYNDEVLSTQLGVSTPDPKRKKRPSPFPDPQGKRILIAKSAFRRRADPSLPIPGKIQRSETEQWRDCILRTATSKGFDGASLVAALEFLPDQPLEKCLRVLQCVCEVANQDLLLGLRDTLRLGAEPPVGQSSDDLDMVKLATLHSSINKFVKVTHLAQFQRYMSQAIYYKWFESMTREKSRLLRRARLERDKMTKYLQSESQSQRDPPQTLTNDTLARNRDMSKSTPAATRVKEELVGLLAHGNKDPERVHEELSRNIREGKVLNLLLSALDNRDSSTDVRFLSLFPLYEFKADSRPSLDLMAHHPPQTFKRLSKPITCQELFDLNEKLLRFFGKHLFTMRPELSQIDVNYLPGGNHLTGEQTLHPEIDGVPSSSIDRTTVRLQDAHDVDIRGTKPVDVMRFFGPAKEVIPAPRRLEFPQERFVHQA